jgi:hypothetical protein
VFTDMQPWAEIRRRVLVDGVSQRQILRATGRHWRTLEKVLAHPEPPGYRAKATRPRPKLGPFLDRVGSRGSSRRTRAARGSSGTPPSGSASGSTPRAIGAAPRP